MFARQRKARGSRDASSVQMVFAVPNIHVSAAAGQCRLPQRYVGVLQEEGTRRLDVVVLHLGACGPWVGHEDFCRPAAEAFLKP